MLTNVHNWVLRELLRRKGKEDKDLSIYLYNIAPDSLPMHKDISAKLTHKITLSKELLKKHPKLIFVKYHLMVDNLGHYGLLTCPKGINNNFEKEGYAYIKGRSLIEEVKKFYQEGREWSTVHSPQSIDENSALYLAHTAVEIALDLKLSEEDESITSLFFALQGSLTPQALEEYYQSLAELYNLRPETIREAREAPLKFYGEPKSKEDFFLDKRVKIILRKSKMEFTRENIDKAKRLVIKGERLLTDYLPTLEDWVKKIELASIEEEETLSSDEP